MREKEAGWEEGGKKKQGDTYGGIWINFLLRSRTMLSTHLLSTSNIFQIQVHSLILLGFEYLQQWRSHSLVPASVLAQSTSTRANHFMAPQSRWPYAERAWAPPGFPSCKSYRHQSMKHCHIYSQQLVPHDEGSCNYKELPCKKIADVIRDNNEYKVE